MKTHTKTAGVCGTFRRDMTQDSDDLFLPYGDKIIGNFIVSRNDNGDHT